MKAEILPRMLEIERFRRSVNRKIWVMIGGLLVLTFLSLLMAFVAFARPVPVVVFDGQGRPILFEDTVAPRVRLDDVRIEYFVENFLERWAAVDSRSVEDDFAKAINMMTPRLRRIVMRDEAELGRRRRYTELNLKGTPKDVEVRIAPYDPEDVHGRVYAVMTGQMVLTPATGELVGSKDHEYLQWLYSELTLARVPVSKESIHGLLVEDVMTKYFESKEDFDVFALKRKR